MDQMISLNTTNVALQSAIVARDAMAFHLDFNNIFKATVVGALGLIPEVGSLISKLVAAIWPDSETNAFPLDQLMDYINSMMSDLIDQQRAHELRVAVNGLQEMMKSYVTATSQQERMSSMQALLNQSTYLLSSFFGESISPQATMTYLVAFGTIRLGLLREKYLFYETIYGQPDGNPAKTLHDLVDEILAFQKRADESRRVAIEWRKNCITIKGPKTSSVGLGINQYVWVVKDSFLRYSREYVKREHINAPPSPNEEQDAKTDYERRQKDVDTIYTAGLDEFLDPARFWPGFDPTKSFTPASREVWEYNVLADGANPGGNRAWDDREFYIKHGPITRLDIYHGDWIDGVEVWYGGVSSGRRGGGGGTRTQIDLRPGEAININGGTVGSYMIRWWVSTNFRTERMGGGGRSGTKDNFWIGYPYSSAVEPVHRRLAYLQGRAAGNRVDQIRIAWLHYEP
ncbi:hypothetical protein H072_6317 [Dactylellina haptotyla CBS 200.50]|uniref:Jacalin-type lectin domain-containing protein n=1 Tax=Dactylellina haptotyla (strain CBS 200.50) TaxID=1284197 RepID=S8AAG1_DACHA|nr:hypothetical protein H072_6317 [Dactylellina haptotyla CBS 200.50]